MALCAYLKPMCLLAISGLFHQRSTWSWWRGIGTTFRSNSPRLTTGWFLSGSDSGAALFTCIQNLARVRHIALRTTGRLVAPGLILLREPGFRVYTRLQLRAELQKHAGASGVAAWTTGAEVDHEEYIYAVFKTCRDSRYADQRWDGAKVMSLIERFESDARNKPVTNLGRTSPDPRILSLRELLKARLLPDGDRSRSDSALEGVPGGVTPRQRERPVGDLVYAGTSTYDEVE